MIEKVPIPAKGDFGRILRKCLLRGVFMREQDLGIERIESGGELSGDRPRAFLLTNVSPSMFGN